MLSELSDVEHLKFMHLAIELSEKSVKNGGGPFGAVIVKGKEVIATAANRVTLDNDPTAHAEIMAIREACKRLGTFDLSGCVLYTSCEPCPMCLSAIYWAHIDAYFYANNKTDAKSIGFDDAFIYEEIAKNPDDRHIRTSQLLHDEAFAVFESWKEKKDKVEY